MPEQTPKTLNHYAFFQFTPVYYTFEPEQKADFHRNLLDALRQAKNLDLSLALSFTALDENIDQIKDVYRLVEGRDIDFFFKPGHDFCSETNQVGNGSTLMISDTTSKKLLAFMDTFLEKDFSGKHSFANSGRKIFYQEMWIY